jgi:hypothetical protein
MPQVPPPIDAGRQVVMSEHPSSDLNADTPTSQEDSQEDWATLTFPHAMSVETIPDRSEDPPVAPSLVSGDSFTKVQQQNQELRDQVAALDAALLRSQHALRSEMERWEALALAQPDPTESSETQLQNQKEEFSGSQARLGQLFVELEQSHRMAQRQQILVETLTDQLQTSHEQIAQLERECASAQARSAEQTQLFMQSENTCRDLRSRLHRQQRYTLQFKAALEKCLDVPPATAQGVVADLFTDTPETPDAPVKINIPRSQPVQPWSSAIESVSQPAPVVLQTWANAVVDKALVDKELVDNAVPDMIAVEPSIAEPLVAPQPPILGESEQMACETPIDSPDSPIEMALETPIETPIESARLDTWEAVLAQVQAIVGEDARIVAPIAAEPLSEEEAATEDAELENDPILNKIKDIAPVINPGRSTAKKRESLAAVELPSFGRRV